MNITNKDDNDGEYHIIINNPLINNSNNYKIEKNEKDCDKNCVICLEYYDNNNNISILHSNLINANCECEYYIHKTCFSKWLKNRPTNEMNCLICSSNGKPVLTYQQYCQELIRKPGCKKTIICIYKSIIWCSIIILCWFFSGILEKQNNNYE